MARKADQMYAALPVFSYQQFDQESISYSPVKPPVTRIARYYGVVSDLRSKKKPEPEPKKEEVEEPKAEGMFCGGSGLC